MADDAPVDLYAGLTVPPPKKHAADDAVNASVDRSNGLSTGVKRATPETASESANKKPKTTGEIDVASAVARLQMHMVVDKKFAKAATLFQTLMREKLAPETSDLFLKALSEMIQHKGGSWSGKREFKDLVQLVLDKQDVFPEAKRSMFVDWELLAVTHYELFTDDTFQFARAAKQIKKRLDAAVTETDSDVRAPQLPLLMPLLRTLFSRHSTAWAKTSVESVLGVCTRSRLLFSDGQRAEVDLWTKTVQERRHASTIHRSAGTDARRNIVEITSDNASQAKAKVGVTNHPLFNRDP